MHVMRIGASLGGGGDVDLGAVARGTAGRLGVGTGSGSSSACAS